MAVALVLQTLGWGGGGRMFFQNQSVEIDESAPSISFPVHMGAAVL